jgi:hypothetical protein
LRYPSASDRPANPEGPSRQHFHQGLISGSSAAQPEASLLPASDEAMN